MAKKEFKGKFCPFQRVSTKEGPVGQVCTPQCALYMLGLNGCVFKSIALNMGNLANIGKGFGGK